MDFERMKEMAAGIDGALQDVSHMKYFYFNKNRFFDGQNETSGV